MLTFARWFLGLSLVLAGCCVVLLIINQSPTFQRCEADYYQHHSPKQTQEVFPDFLVAAIPVRKCIGAFIDTNEGTITAVFAIVLTLFSAVLALFMISLARSTRIAANAAKDSADTLFSLERPRLTAEFYFLNGGTIDEKLQLGDLAARFKNLGRTSVEPISHSLDWHIGLYLPNTPKYEHHKTAKTGSIIEANANPSYVISERHQFFGEDNIRTILENKTTLWVYAYIKYRDFAGNTCTRGFAAKSQIDLEGGDAELTFTQTSSVAYDYIKRRRR